MKPPLIVAGDAHPELARAIAQAVKAPLAAASISAFADGETRVRIEGDVRDRAAVLVQPTSPPTNERLMTLLLLADAAHAAGAANVAAMIPYFGYARQDVRAHPGEARSASLAARLLGAAGIERVLVLELHSPALESAFPMPVVQLRADEVVLNAIRAHGFTIVAPDAGGLKRAQRYATALGAPLAVVTKDRPRADVAKPLQVLGYVAGASCLIVDDMASTGRTIAGAAQALLAAGAAEVNALFIHAVLAPGALERMREAGVRRLITTDSVRAGADAGVEVLPIAPLFAEVLSR